MAITDYMNIKVLASSKFELESCKVQNNPLRYFEIDLYNRM